jgi:glucose-1-phosphate cytidylyltransferase
MGMSLARIDGPWGTLMKAVILAGGLGTRLSEETRLVPKPMVEIGGRPVIWHIMKYYSTFGIREFIICCGYRGDVIKQYFLDYRNRHSDMTVDLQTGEVERYNARAEDWKVVLIDTGQETMTGGRLKRIAPYVGNDAFCMTYGDGVSDVDIAALVASHRQSGLSATVTAIHQPSRFGVLEISRNRVQRIREKAVDDGAWINGGFFVLEPNIFDFITHGDETIWEREPLEALVAAGQLGVYKHNGFWQSMDTLRDRSLLETLWESGAPPWKRW